MLCLLQVGAVPGYTTGHVEQPGAMQNTYNNYSTRTQTVYGPAAMTRSPVTMPAPTNYMAKTTSIAAGGPALVSQLHLASVNVTLHCPRNIA